MTKSIAAFALGLLLSILYFFQSDLLLGNNNIIKAQKIDSIKQVDFSNIGDSLANINWTNPIQINASNQLNHSSNLDASAQNNSDEDNSNQVVELIVQADPNPQLNQNLNSDSNSDSNLNSEPIDNNSEVSSLNQDGVDSLAQADTTMIESDLPNLSDSNANPDQIAQNNPAIQSNNPTV